MVAHHLKYTHNIVKTDKKRKYIYIYIATFTEIQL